MKRLISVLLAALMLLAVLAGCGGNNSSNVTSGTPSTNTPASGAASEGMPVPPMSLDFTDRAIEEEIIAFITQDTKNPDAVVFRYTCTMPGFAGMNPAEMGVREFFRSLKEKLGDKIKIELYFNAPFGTSADDLIGGMQNGTFEAINYSVGSYGEYTNAFFPADAPFLFKNIDDATEKLNAGLGEVMSQKCLDDINIRILSYCAFGMRHISNSKREIHVPDDMKGLKMRVQNNAVHIALMQAFGASATPMAYAELYTGLQQGVVDGQENPVLNYLDQRFEEVQDYLTLTGHMCTITALAVSNEWFEKQSAEIQDALVECAKAFPTYGVQTANEQTDGVIDMLSQSMQIYRLTDDEWEQWAERGRAVWPQVAELSGKDHFQNCMDAMGIEWNG